MLTLNSSEFTCGRSEFLDFLEEAREPTAKIYVKITLGDLHGGSGPTLYAQLDTGAAWSVLAPEVAESLGLLELDGESTVLQTRLGRKAGHLVRIPVIFPADGGRPLTTEGTFFVTSDWPTGRTFLGYSGLLDSMRIALDPQVNNFYFGA